MPGCVQQRRAALAFRPPPLDLRAVPPIPVGFWIFAATQWGPLWSPIPRKAATPQRSRRPRSYRRSPRLLLRLLRRRGLVHLERVIVGANVVRAIVGAGVERSRRRPSPPGCSPRPADAAPLRRAAHVFGLRRASATRVSRVPRSLDPVGTIQQVPPASLRPSSPFPSASESAAAEPSVTCADHDGRRCTSNAPDDEGERPTVAAEKRGRGCAVAVRPPPPPPHTHTPSPAAPRRARCEHLCIVEHRGAVRRPWSPSTERRWGRRVHRRPRRNALGHGVCESMLLDVRAQVPRRRRAARPRPAASPKARGEASRSGGRRGRRGRQRVAVRGDAEAGAWQDGGREVERRDQRAQVILTVPDKGRTLARSNANAASRRLQVGATMCARHRLDAHLHRLDELHSGRPNHVQSLSDANREGRKLWPLSCPPSTGAQLVHVAFAKQDALHELEVLQMFGGVGVCGCGCGCGWRWGKAEYARRERRWLSGRPAS